MSESENEEELNDLEAAIGSLESNDSVEVDNDEEVPTKSKECVPCSRGELKCNYCNDDNEWPVGRICKICKGTGIRK